MSTTNYWGFRTNWRNPEVQDFLYEELKENRLRQGWGWKEDQKLPNCIDRGAKRNLPIYDKVKEGDYLLIPHMPTYSEVTIAQATSDFKSGYTYEIAERKADGQKKGFKDYGHIFPAIPRKIFALKNENVDACILSSFRNRGRFWRMWGCGEAIENLLKLDEEKLRTVSSYANKIDIAFKNALSEIWNEEQLKNCLQKEFLKTFQGTDWEFALVHLFRKLLPYYNVDRIGGKSEKEHGCDIKITIPGIEEDKSYVIGIQVKDYKDVVGDRPIKQVLKADDYWASKDINEKLIDKYVVLIGANKERNCKFEQEAESKHVSVIYEDGVADLLLRSAKWFVANRDF